MKTERLFDKSSKIREFEATVLSCEPKGDGKYAVILDRTAFFPNEGGQSCDGGIIGGIKVLSVDEFDGIIIHTLPSPLAVGASVPCRLDYIGRFRKMQNHTAEHIVSGLVHSMFGYENVGFHLGDGYMTADFDGELSREDIERIETRANIVIFSCRRVRAYYPNSEELKILEYRSKLDLTDNVRIVEIEDTDMCACCAPHVENTGEVGLLKIVDAIRYKGGMRLTMVAGLDALADYRARCEQIRQVSTAISAKQSEVADGVLRLLDEVGKLKGRVSALGRELMQKKLDSLDATEGSIILFEDFDDMLSLRNFVNEGVKKCGKFFAVFTPDGDGYKYIIASRSLDLKPLSKKLNNALSGRGGGNERMIQGSCRADRKSIEQFFDDEPNTWI